MGCGSSKDAKDDNTIDSNFEETRIASFDNIFTNASNVLATCEKIRAGLEDTRDDGMEIAGTDQLEDPQYVETLKVLLWALRAQSMGGSADIDFDVSEEKPYVKIKGFQLLNEETKNLYNTFKEYVTTITDSPGDLKAAMDSLEQISQQLPDLVNNAKTDIESSGLGFKEKAQALMRLKKNATKLPKELAKCKHLSEVLKQSATDLKQLITELKTLVKSADEMGKKAADAKLLKPKEIFDKFHTGKRKEETKDEKKGGKKDEKKGGKKDEKKAQPKQTK